MIKENIDVSFSANGVKIVEANGRKMCWTFNGSLPLGNTFGSGTIVLEGTNISPAEVRKAGLPETQGAATTFTNTAVNTGTDTITVTSHGRQTGDAVVFTTSGTPPNPLVAATEYFIIRTGVNTFKLATTYANAIAGTAIDITTTGGVGDTQTLTPGCWQTDTTHAIWEAISIGGAAYSITASDSEWVDAPVRYYRFRLTGATTPVIKGTAYVVSEAQDM